MRVLACRFAYLLCLVLSLAPPRVAGRNIRFIHLSNINQLPNDTTSTPSVRTARASSG